MDSLAGKSTSETSSEDERGRWETVAAERRFRPVTMTDMLDELLELGFSRALIAKAVDVPVGQVIRWRTVDAWILSERLRVSDLLATCDMLKSPFGWPDPPAFFEMRLAPQCVIDMAEIYATGRLDLVLGFASHNLTEEQVLDDYDPQWRSIPQSMWEVVLNGDGEASICMKSYAEKLEEFLPEGAVEVLMREMDSDG